MSVLLIFVKSNKQKQSSGGVHQRLFLEISQNSQENTCARVSFLIKLQGSGNYISIPPKNLRKPEISYVSRGYRTATLA